MPAGKHRRAQPAPWANSRQPLPHHERAGRRRIEPCLGDGYSGVGVGEGRHDLLLPVDRVRTTQQLAGWLLAQHELHGTEGELVGRVGLPVAELLELRLCECLLRRECAICQQQRSDAPHVDLHALAHCPCCGRETAAPREPHGFKREREMGGARRRRRGRGRRVGRERERKREREREGERGQGR
eukprot:scaffold177622_cov30-Tisochrysis_lutea.AAC.1